jgi:hypothetical protein
MFTGSGEDNMKNNMKVKNIFMLKMFLFLAFILGAAGSVFAQDFIVLRDGNFIPARITEISPLEIRYLRYDHLDGPVLVIPAASVLSILFDSGRLEIITAGQVAAQGEFAQGQRPVREPVVRERQPERFSSVGLSLGGGSNIGFSTMLTATASPGRFTFFDFGLGYNFIGIPEGRIGFNFLVPWNNGGWRIGFGLAAQGVWRTVTGHSGGWTTDSWGNTVPQTYTYEQANLSFPVVLSTGVILFNWMNLGLDLNISNFYGPSVKFSAGAVRWLRTRVRVR